MQPHPPDDTPASAERSLASLLDPLWQRTFPVRDDVGDTATREGRRQRPGCIVRPLAPSIRGGPDAPDA